MNAYLELIRAGNCAMAAIAATIGVFIAYNILISNSYGSVPVPLYGSLLVFMTVFMVTGAGNAINDYFDIEIDRVNKPERPIPSGRIGLTVALYFSLALFSIGTLFAFLINPVCGIIALANSLLLIYYAKVLKRTAFVGNLAVGYLTGSTFLFGGAVFFENGGLESVFVLFLLATLATVAREIVKDIEDTEGDKMDGARTLPIVIGQKRSAYLAAIIGLIAVLASPLPYLQSFMSIRYLLLVAVADLLFVIAVCEILGKGDPGKSSRMFKMAMAFALLSFIAGA
ncbi:MAG: geranylgeranylglycerol-phosphate geranylgeranyltransferase [Methanosarcinaceae archaeon]|nr:geranylgeranylglycerol-phosphate geranylgeranyltransferase [Methanosarcinaceae archaeon]